MSGSPAAVAPAESCDEAQPGGASLLGALVIVARHRGLDLSEKQLRRDHRLGPGGLLPEALLQIAGACGMRAAATRLRFRDLMELKDALPAILLLRNGSAMVLLRRAERSPAARHRAGSDVR